MPDPKPSNESPSSGINAVPVRPGPWRVISLIVVLATLILVALSVLQARAASDLPVSQQRELQLDPTVVTVDDQISVPDGSAVAVLGLPQGDSRRPFDPAGTSIDLPSGNGALVSLTDPGDNIIGLAVVSAAGSRSEVQISAQSTAQALLVLSPGMLRPNLVETLANMGVIEADPGFQTLVDALAANSNITQANDQAEVAFAAIADRLPIQGAPADQGCDSVASRDAYVSAGTCVQPESGGLTVSNEQDRWVLVFHETVDGPVVCAVLAPAGTIGDEELIPLTTCQGQARLAAPGPQADYRDEQAIVDRHVSVATAVTMLHEYIGPFADLAAGSAGFASESASRIRRDFVLFSQAIEVTIDSNEEFASLMTLPGTATTAAQRHLGAVRAADLLIEGTEPGALLAQRSAPDTGHQGILDFFERAGTQMTSPRTDWRWVANASDTLDFGAAE